MQPAKKTSGQTTPSRGRSAASTLPQGQGTPASLGKPIAPRLPSSAGQPSSSSAPHITPPQVPGKATPENNRQVQEILDVIHENMDGAKIDPNDRAHFPLIANKLIELGEYIQTIKGPLKEDLNQQLNQLVHTLIKDERFLSDRGKLWAIHVDAVWLAHQMRKNDRINQNTWTTTWLTQEKENDILRIAGDTLARAEQDPDLSNKIHPSLRYNYNCIRNLWSPSRQYTISRDTEKRILALEDDKKILEEQNRTQHQKLLQQAGSLEQMDQKLQNAHEQRQKNEQLQKEIELLKTKLEQQNKSSEDVKRAAEDASKKFAEENEQFQKNLAKKEQEIEKEKKISELYKNANLKSTNENLGLKSQIGILTEKAKTDKTEIEKLKDAKTALEKAQEQQNIEIETQKKENQNLQIKNQQLQDQLDQQVKTIEKQKAKIELVKKSEEQETKNANAALEALLAEEEKSAELKKELVSENENLQGIIGNLKQKIEEDKQNLQREKQQNEEQINKQNTVNSTLSKENEQLQKQINIISNEKSQLNADKKELEEQLERRQEESNKKEQQLASENESSKQQLKQEKDKVSELEKKDQELQEKINQQEEELNNLKAKLGQEKQLKERDEILEKFKNHRLRTIGIESNIKSWESLCKAYLQLTHFFELPPSPGLKSSLKIIEQLQNLLKNYKEVVDQSSKPKEDIEQLKTLLGQADSIHLKISEINETLKPYVKQIKQNLDTLDEQITSKAKKDDIDPRNLRKTITSLEVSIPIKQEEILEQKFKTIHKLFLDANALLNHPQIESSSESRAKTLFNKTQEWLEKLRTLRRDKEIEEHELFEESNKLFNEAFEIIETCTNQIPLINKDLDAITNSLKERSKTFHNTQKEILQKLNILMEIPGLENDLPNYWEMIKQHLNDYENANNDAEKILSLKDYDTLLTKTQSRLREINKLELTINNQIEKKEHEKAIFLEKEKQLQKEHELIGLQNQIKEQLTRRFKEIQDQTKLLERKKAQIANYSPEAKILEDAQTWLTSAEKALNSEKQTYDNLNKHYYIPSGKILTNLKTANRKIQFFHVPQISQSNVVEKKQVQEKEPVKPSRYDIQIKNIRSEINQIRYTFIENSLCDFRPSIINDRKKYDKDFEFSLEEEFAEIKKSDITQSPEEIQTLGNKLFAIKEKYLNIVQTDRINMLEQIKFFQASLPMLKFLILVPMYNELATKIERVQKQLDTQSNMIIENELLQTIADLNKQIANIPNEKPRFKYFEILSSIKIKIKIELLNESPFTPELQEIGLKIEQLSTATHLAYRLEVQRKLKNLKDTIAQSSAEKTDSVLNILNDIDTYFLVNLIDEIVINNRKYKSK